MTDKATLLALAERCEKATGPDRELDRDIADALKLGPVGDDWERPKDTPATASSRGYVSMDKGSWVRRGLIRHSKCYTSSLDAAMMLLPVGMDWCVGNEFAGIKEAFATVAYSTEGNREAVFAATPSLALTAACLRARAA